MFVSTFCSPFLYAHAVVISSWSALRWSCLYKGDLDVKPLCWQPAHSHRWVEIQASWKYGESTAEFDPRMLCILHGTYFVCPVSIKWFFRICYPEAIRHWGLSLSTMQGAPLSDPYPFSDQSLRENHLNTTKKTPWLCYGPGQWNCQQMASSI